MGMAGDRNIVRMGRDRYLVGVIVDLYLVIGAGGIVIS